MSAEHTPGTLAVSADGYSLLAEALPTSKWRDEIATVSDSHISEDRALANAKRLAACWNACREMDTDRLIELTERGLTLELALHGSLLLENKRVGEQVGEQVLSERLQQIMGAITGAAAEEKPGDEQDERYPLSRGD